MIFIELDISFFACLSLIILGEQCLVAKLTQKGDRDAHWFTKESITICGKKVTYAIALLASLSLPTVVIWFMTRNWILNNFIALCLGACFLKVSILK
mmetsp:Transcript_7401/g.8939  ORF Transcript_7401/g.8939 Transcript_7401/m.8939 type:complete len:97 (+) Transcript_7401:610-900(+)